MKGLSISSVAKPTKIDEAVAMLEEWGSTARLVAGNTTIYELARQGALADVDKLIDVTNLGLDYVKENANILYVGAATTFTQLTKSNALDKPSIFSLKETARRITPPQVRNMGTVGGAISSGIPFYDMPTTILALGANIRTASKKGERIVSSDDFFVDYFVTALSPNELVLEVQVPILPSTGTGFIKIGRTSVDFAVVNSSVRITLDETMNRVTDARIALGAVAGKPIRSLSAENALIGSNLSKELILNASKKAAEIEPTPSVHASSSYKKKIIPVAVRDAILSAIDRARAAAQKRVSN